jgi:probable O-glycosylation ligase (exosortase A-associated)
MPFRDIIIVGIVIGAIPYILRRPWSGILMWAWISYMAPHRLCWSFAYDFPVAAITAGALFLGMLLNREPGRMPRSAVLWPWALFVVWTCITLATALNPDGAFTYWTRFIKGQGLTLCVMLLITNRVRLEAFLLVVAMSIGFYGVKGALFAIGTGFESRVWGPPDSAIDGNNEIALALLMVMPLLRYFQVFTPKKLHKNVYLGTMAFSLISALSTYSRGALLAMGMMTASLVWKSKRRAAMLLLVVAAVPIAVSLMPDKWFDRMNTIHTYQEDSSAMGRINAWHFAWNLAKDRPLTGGGMRTFTKLLFYKYAPNPLDHHDAHSIYFQVLAEQGFPGLAFFLLTIFMGYRLCSAIMKRTEGIPEVAWANELSRMIQVSLLAYLTGGAFLGLAYFDLPYHLIAVAVIANGLVERQLARPAGAPPLPEPGLYDYKALESSAPPWQTAPVPRAQHGA